jgi:transposase
MHCIGLDVHKKKISCCVKDVSGQIHAEGCNRSDAHRSRPLNENTPATVDGHDESDHLHGVGFTITLTLAEALKVAHPLMLRAIAAAKKENDRSMPARLPTDQGPDPGGACLHSADR